MSDTVEAGTTGNKPTQKLANFTLKDIDGTDRQLSEFLQGGASEGDVVVIYFTMWCSTCMAHSAHIENIIMPTYAEKGTVRYLMIDYVNGDVDAAEASAQANGVANSEFVVLVDSGAVRQQLGGNMAITLVVDADGTVMLNQEFGTGAFVEEALDAALAN